MRFVFFGTPEYVLPVLKTLAKELAPMGENPVEAVVTQPPRPSGRQQKLQYTPVDSWAHRRDVPIFHSPEQFIKSGIKTDFAVLAAFGAIVPEKIISYFPKGILNVHPSLLPAYRGASPVQAAIVADEKQTGVSIMKLDEKMDHGPIVSSFKEPVLPDDTTESLRQRLFERSGEFLVELIPAYLSGKVKVAPQDHDKATYTTLIRKEHGFVPPKLLAGAIEGKVSEEEWEIGFVKGLTLKASPENLMRFMRATSPWPGVWTKVTLSETETKRLKILDAAIEGDRFVIKEVQLEARNPVSWRQFTEGYPEAKFA